MSFRFGKGLVTDKLPIRFVRFFFPNIRLTAPKWHGFVGAPG